MSDSVIVLKKVSKIYRVKNSEVEALHNVDLNVRKGDRILITGQSGSGKSTLINIIGCVDNAYMGNYYFYNQDSKLLKDKDRARVRNEEFGYIFQEYELVESLSVYDNIKIPLEYSKKTKKQEHHQMILDMLNKIGLKHKEKVLVKHLSGGQRQRVAIGRALINNPNIILADEPTSSLDDETADEIIALIFSLLDEKRILILISHQNLNSQLFNRYLQLDNGRIIEKNDKL